ncbi:MAG: hypothetical protein JXB46_08605, partial [Candidatus Eisenbacteria bacterium]|nr:hypothetical protein [Candidatus Eisenbacteria bacterium]
MTKRLLLSIPLVLLSVYASAQILTTAEVTAGDGLRGTRVLCHVEDAEGLLLSTNDGLFRFDEGRFVRLSVGSAGVRDFTCMVTCADGYVFATDVELLHVRPAAGGLEVSERLPLSTAAGESYQLTDLCRTDSGVCAATTRGLALYELGTNGFSLSRVALPAKQVRSVVTDTEGIYCLFAEANSPDSEIACLAPKTLEVAWRVPLSGSYWGISAVDGILLTASAKEILSVRMGGTIGDRQSFFLQRDVSGVQARLVYADPSRAFVAGTFPNLMVVDRASGHAEIAELTRDAPRPVTDFFKYADRYWIGTDSGLYYRSDGVTVRSLPSESGKPDAALGTHSWLPSNSVRAVMETEGGVAFFTAQGVSLAGEPAVPLVEGTQHRSTSSPAMMGNFVVFAADRILAAGSRKTLKLLPSLERFEQSINSVWFDSQEKILYVALQSAGIRRFAVDQPEAAGIVLTRLPDIRARAIPDGLSKNARFLVGDNVTQILTTDRDLYVASDTGYHFFANKIVEDYNVREVIFESGTSLPLRVNQLLVLSEADVLLGTEKGLRLVRMAEGKLSEVTVSSDRRLAAIDVEIGRNNVRALRQMGPNTALLVDGVGILMLDPDTGAFSRVFREDALGKVRLTDVAVVQGRLLVATEGMGAIEMPADQIPPRVALFSDGKPLRIVDGNAAVRIANGAVFPLEIWASDDCCMASSLSEYWSTDEESYTKLSGGTLNVDARGPQTRCRIVVYDQFMNRATVDLTIANDSAWRYRALLFGVISVLVAGAALAGLLIARAAVVRRRRDAETNARLLKAARALEDPERVFSSGDPLQAADVDRFTDRVAEISDCASLLANERIVNVYGQRRIGKNSLYNIVLAKLRQTDPGLRDVTLPTPSSANLPLEDFLAALGSLIAASAHVRWYGGATIPALFEALRQLMDRPEMEARRMVVLLDDVPPLVAGSGLGRVVKEFGNDPALKRIRFAILSKAVVHDQVSNYQESMITLTTKRVILLPFNREQTVDFWSKYGALLDEKFGLLRFELTDEFKAHTYEITNGCPYLLQLIGSEMERHAQEQLREHVLQSGNTERREARRRGNTAPLVFSPSLAFLDSYTRSKGFTTRVNAEYVVPEFWSLDPTVLKRLERGLPRLAAALDIKLKQYLVAHGLIREDGDHIEPTYP